MFERKTAIITIFLGIGAAVLPLSACSGVPDSQGAGESTPSVRAAAVACMPHRKMKIDLFKLYRETLQSTGTVKLSGNQGAIALFYASPNGSWSVVLAGPNGLSCLALWGNDFRREKPPDEKKI